MTRMSDGRLPACLGAHRRICLLRVLKLGLAAIGEVSAASARPLNPAELSRRIAELDLAEFDIYCRVQRALLCEHRQPVPRYDGSVRELWLGNTLIHRFAPQAWKLIAVLTTLQREGWPEEICDPLKNAFKPGFEKRLHDTVCTLNRLQSPQLIQFSATSSDRKLRWALVERITRRRAHGKSHRR
jgi:hypothetical protein